MDNSNLDIEKDPIVLTGSKYATSGSSSEQRQHHAFSTETSSTADDSTVGKGMVFDSSLGFLRRFADSFRRMDNGEEIDVSEMTPAERSAAVTAKSSLKRGLKGRHLQMIAIGGTIGTGLFVGSGESLNSGGPASLLIGYFLTGCMLFCTVHALGELAVRFPVAGAFATYSTRFLDPAWGFAMGWIYGLQWLILLPLELVAASLTIQYWRSDGGSSAANVNPDAWVAVFYFLILFINIFGVRAYGETEFIFSTIKVIAVIGFIILGIVLVAGGSPNHIGYIGGKYWHNPGAFADGFKGVVSVFVNAAFAFSGTELVGLAAAETENPHKALPSASKQVFWRITLFYIIALTLVGLLVPYTDPRLLGSSSVDATASPFVIAITNAGIKGLPSVINAVILISALSVGNSSVYGCSRTFAALADQGQAPKILGYIDREGRPIVGIGITLLFGLLCFLAGSSAQATVFDWLLSFSGMASLFTWGSICLSHIRFRRSMKLQNISLEQLTFKSVVGIWGSWFGFLMNVIILAFQFWVALYPIGVSTPNASDFFQIFLSVPLVIVMYVGYKIWFRCPIVRAKDMDIISGARQVDLDVHRQEMAEEIAVLKTRNWFYRTYKFWC